MQTSTNTSASKSVSVHLFAETLGADFKPKDELWVALRKVRAKTRCLYLKTKSFRARFRGQDCRAYHPFLEPQVEQLLVTNAAISELMRRMGGPDGGHTDYSDPSRALDEYDVEFACPEDVLDQLRVDNQILAGSLRSARASWRRCDDILIQSLIDLWIDEARRRAWCLFEWRVSNRTGAAFRRRHREPLANHRSVDRKASD